MALVPHGDAIDLSEAVARKLLDDVRVHGFRIANVEIAFGLLAETLSGQTAAVERRRQLRIDLERVIEIGDSILALTVLQIDEAAAVERVHETWSQPQRLVAVL